MPTGAAIDLSEERIMTRVARCRRRAPPTREEAQAAFARAGADGKRSTCARSPRKPKPTCGE